MGEGWSRSYLELHVQVLLSQGENANSGLRLAQVVIDADQSLHCRLRTALILMLLVVQGLGKRMALLGQST